MNAFLILGNQLFDKKYFPKSVTKESLCFFMKEDQELATYFRFHKHKIILFFAAMRSYREELKSAGYTVHYETYSSHASSYIQALREFILKKKIKKLIFYEIEDKFFEQRILDLVNELSLDSEVLQSPMFLTSRADFREYLARSKKPFMKSFYQDQRKRLNILMKDGKPVGGTWSFDEENRLALPKNTKTPELPEPQSSVISQEVIHLVDKEFSSHPGEGKDFWLPTDRKAAKNWMKSFINDRLYDFGPYEDAIPRDSEFVYHSVLAPLLNVGLITPDELIEEVLFYSSKNKVPLNSTEGFIRQVIGWREFVRGVYQNYSQEQDTRNFFSAKNKLSSVWYGGKTGIPPLDESLKRVSHRGYVHHIERLMILGNFMTLLEIDPSEAHKWFMEMFVDSSDWVMGPNVYGMALHSDGGIFSTKPYICGSNYLRKMGGYSKSDWCDGVDGLYWNFILKNEKFFLKNPRLSMIARSAKKIPAERMNQLNRAAIALKQKLTVI